jgi:choline kinase
VILAAGMGVRLRELGESTPKGFLRLGEHPIIAESIERLASVGIERIVLATGYRADRFEELARSRPRLITTANNPRYAESGSLYSLHCARAELTEDFLLLESDLIYERRALREALEHPSPDVLLVSGPTGAGDEVFVESREGLLVNMSKKRAMLGPSIAGELVGITRVSQPFFREMLAVGERLFRETLKVDYELEGLVQAARVRAMAVHLVPDLVWAEIDDPQQLERARKRVYPELVKRDALPALG